MAKRGLIPKPRSNFVKVKCVKCGNEQIIFDRASTVVTCTVCDERLAEPRRGKAKITAEILQILE